MRLSANRYRAALGGSPLVFASTLAGCLTVNNLPQGSDAQVDAGQEILVDATVVDTGTNPPIEPQPDATVSVVQPSLAKCRDEGPLTYGELTFHGQRNVCAAGTTCSADKTCVAMPECAPGVSTACTYHPAGTHGRWLNGALDGSYYYWIESGSFDKLDNYLGDGVIARVKIGEWRREELVTGLSLMYAGGFVNTNLRVEGTHGFVRLGGHAYQFPATPGAALTEDEADQSTWIACLDGSNQYFGLRGATTLEVHRRTLGSTALGEDLGTGDSTSLSSEESCVIEGGYFYAGSLRLAVSEHKFDVMPERVVGRDGDKLVGLRTVLDRFYVAVAKQGAQGALTWQNMMQIPDYSSGYQTRLGKVGGGFFYWKQQRNDDWRTHVVVRAALDGSSEQPEIVDYGDVAEVYPASSGVLWIETPPEKAIPTMHYVPSAR